jgi:hypothetical protein
MESHDKKRKVAMEDAHVQFELTPIMPLDEESNYRRQVMGKDVRVQTELTAIMFDDLERNYRQVMSKIMHDQTEQAVMTLDDLKRKYREQVIGKDVHIQTELTAVMMDDLERNNRRQIMEKDIDVQIGQTPVTLDVEQTNDRRRVLGEEVEVENDSVDKFDGPHLNLVGEETPDQGQVVVIVKASDNVLDDSMTKNCRVVEVTTDEQNSTTTKIITDIIEDLGPVIGYAEELLLPLVKACAPLTDILHDLSRYVEMALIETPEMPPDGLSIDESAAIRLYTIEWDRPHRSLYSELNRTLKKDSREHLRPYFKYMKLFLTALVKLPCAPSSTVWRGVTKNVSVEFPPGTPVTWWTFSSTTTSLPVLENNMYLGNTGDRTLFSVETINGRTVRAHSHFGTEDEILLLPGTQMIVQSQFSPAPDLNIIHLKQVIPEEMLLEPPFEGIFQHFQIFILN